MPESEPGFEVVRLKYKYKDLKISDIGDTLYLYKVWYPSERIRFIDSDGLAFDIPFAISQEFFDSSKGTDYSFYRDGMDAAQLTELKVTTKQEVLSHINLSLKNNEYPSYYRELIEAIIN